MKQLAQLSYINCRGYFSMCIIYIQVRPHSYTYVNLLNFEITKSCTGKSIESNFVFCQQKKLGSQKKIWLFFFLKKVKKLFFRDTNGQKNWPFFWPFFWHVFFSCQKRHNPRGGGVFLRENRLIQSCFGLVQEVFGLCFWLKMAYFLVYFELQRSINDLGN